MKKKLIIGSVAALVIAVTLIIVLWSSLNSIVKYAIEKYGTEALQTKVSVENISIKPIKGFGSIDEITVANPTGYSENDVFRLRNITLKIDISSITKDVVIIDELDIRSPNIYFEVNKQNKTNILELQKNMRNLEEDAQQKTSNSERKEKTKADNDTDAGKRIIIKKLVFANAKVDVNIVNANKRYSLVLPSIELHNIGGVNGATPKQLGVEIASKLLKNVSSGIAESKIKGYLDGHLSDQNKSLLGKVKGLMN